MFPNGLIFWVVHLFIYKDFLRCATQNLIETFSKRAPLPPITPAGIPILTVYVIDDTFTTSSFGNIDIWIYYATEEVGDVNPFYI